jgi:DNA repair exonuclease SbcCD ATPase subunit
MNSFAGGQKQQEIARVAQGLADTMKVSLEGLDELFLGSEESLSDYAKRISEVLDQYKQRLKMFDKDVENNTYLSDLTPTDADLFKEQIPFLEKYLGYFEAFLKQQKNAPKDTFTPMLRSVTELYEEFKRLQGSFDDLTAKEGALAKFGDAFKEAFDKTPEEMGFDLFSEEGAKKAYDYLISKAPDAKKKIQAQLAKGEIVWDVKLETKKDADKKLLDDIQKLFDRYDLSLELKNLNIPSELAKSLFDVDYLDLDGLKGAIEARKSEFLGKDMLKEYDELMKKIGDLQRKRQEDEAKEFINFLKKNLNEIQIIQDKGAYNIALADKLFGQGKITAEQYMSSIRQIVDDTNKEVARVNLDKFKDSATYIKAMGNLAAYSRDELEGMINALQGQVGANAGNMGADEIRAYYEALERLVEQYDKIESPFQKGEINDLIEYLNLQKQLNQEKGKEAVLEQRKEEINGRLLLLQAQLDAQKKRGDILGAASTQREIKSAVAELKEVDGQIVSVASNILVISERVDALGDGMVKNLAVAHKIVNEIANVANAATKIFDDVKSAADALGADAESSGWAKAGYAMEMVGGVSSELTSGLASLASGDFAGALASVVGMVTKLISGFAKIHDQDYQDIIGAQAEQVERLGKAYEKLEKATEEAYSIEQLQQANKELERNVELQMQALRAMMAAERAKKNTNEEQIAAWNEELEALTQQWEDLKDSLLEGMGGVSEANYRSQTREFVDSWVSAFKETGDGLSGLKENFREFFDNIIAEQAALRVTEKFLAPFYDSLNTALDDLSLSVEESKNLREEADKIMPQLSEALELIWNQLGGSRKEDEGGGLSGLQKGIQGITEDTAQIIEAYLNSIRGYVSEQVTYTKRLYEMFDRMSRGTTYGLNVRMIS